MRAEIANDKWKRRDNLEKKEKGHKRYIMEIIDSN